MTCVKVEKPECVWMNLNECKCSDMFKQSVYASQIHLIFIYIELHSYIKCRNLNKKSIYTYTICKIILHYSDYKQKTLFRVVLDLIFYKNMYKSYISKLLHLTTTVQFRLPSPRGHVFNPPQTWMKILSLVPHWIHPAILSTNVEHT